jgi:hypothetical protein
VVRLQKQLQLRSGWTTSYPQTIENIGGADRDRTDDLLNAIILDLSRASYSCKKYPAFLTAEGQQFFPP